MSQVALSLCCFATVLIGSGFWLVLSITAFILILAKLSSLVGATQMLQRRTSFVRPVPRTILLRLLLSAGAALILGAIALPLYWFSFCIDGGTDCLLYSPTRRWMAYLLAPPIFLMQSWFFGTLDRVANFDPVVSGKYGWAVLWAYYYVVISAVAPLIRRFRKI